MANKILITPGGTGQVPAGQVLVGDGYTGDLATFNGKIFVFDVDNIPEPDPYNPLNLPPNTIRCKFKSGYTPTMGDTRTLVNSSQNIWDIETRSRDWYSLFVSCTDLLVVLGGNTKNVTCMDWMFANCSSLTTVNIFSMENVQFSTTHGNFSMFQGCSSLTTLPNFYFPRLTILGQCFYQCTSLKNVPKWEMAHVESTYNMFAGCTSLETVPLFDMQNVSNCNWMFNACTSLKSIPLFDLRSASEANNMFNGCVKVESGALALYNSIKDDPPERHSEMFYNCGRDTETGAAELAQIPDDWK